MKIRMFLVTAVVGALLFGCSSIDRVTGRDGEIPVTPERELQMAIETHTFLLDTASALYENGVLTQRDIRQVKAYSDIAASVLARWESLIQSGSSAESAKKDFDETIENIREIVYGDANGNDNTDGAANSEAGDTTD